MKTVGIATIHGISNFGSLLQTYATQCIVERLGYQPTIINYRYPNEYHLEQNKLHNPYASYKAPFWMRLRRSLYYRLLSASVNQRKSMLFKKEQDTLLRQTDQYPNQKSLQNNPPKFDIYLTGSDQVWNPRYMYEDCTYMLNFIHGVPKVAFSASFGTTNLDDVHKRVYRPLLEEYSSISLREQSGVGMAKEICGKDAECTCDPTLLLNGEEWAQVFNDKPIIKGEYILCYVLTYTANPYPYATTFIKHIQKHLKKKVIVLDETGLYWMDPTYKSFQCYGPREIINLFQHASFIISSSFHGAAFSINFKKNFYSLFPKGVKDERQESLLRIVGAEDRFIRIGDPLPAPSDFSIQDWDSITEKLDAYRHKSINYLSQALENAAKLTK